MSHLNWSKCPKNVFSLLKHWCVVPICFLENFNFLAFEIPQWHNFSYPAGSKSQKFRNIGSSKDTGKFELWCTYLIRFSSFSLLYSNSHALGHAFKSEPDLQWRSPECLGWNLGDIYSGMWNLQITSGSDLGSMQASQCASRWWWPEEELLELWWKLHGPSLHVHNWRSFLCRRCSHVGF